MPPDVVTQFHYARSSEPTGPKSATSGTPCSLVRGLGNSGTSATVGREYRRALLGRPAGLLSSGPFLRPSERRARAMDLRGYGLTNDPSAQVANRSLGGLASGITLTVYLVRADPVNPSEARSRSECVRTPEILLF
jgi:hypothetical protein